MVDSKAAKELAIKLKNCGIMITMSKELLRLRKQKKNILTISQFIDMSYQLEKDITADDISFLLEVLENKS